MDFMDFMVARLQALPDHLHVQPVASHCEVLMGRLAAEADGMWSVVQQKTNTPGVWTAMDRQARRIIAFHVGDRSRDGAKQLGAKLPEVYRTRATF